MHHAVDQIPQVRKNRATRHDRDLLYNANTGVSGLP